MQLGVDCSDIRVKDNTHGYSYDLGIRELARRDHGTSKPQCNSSAHGASSGSVFEVSRLQAESIGDENRF